MLEEKLISIIIPTYNRAHLIGKTLDSIINQTYKNWECIIVDDGSLDNTKKNVDVYCKKDNRFQYYTRPETLRKGANACRNYGCKMSKGEYLQWFDSDDLMLPKFLQKKINLFIEKPLSNYNICGFTLFDDHKIIREYLPFLKNNIAESSLKRYIRLNTPTIMFKRELIKSFNYNENLSRAQDLDFVFRVVTSENAVGDIITESLVNIRIHENSITAGYNNFKKKDLESSIIVWGNICNFFIKQKNIELEKLAKLNYLSFYQNALKKRRYSFFTRNILRENIFSFRVKLKLLILGVLYMLIGKGVTKMKSII